MSTPVENYHRIRAEIPTQATLIAVSKTHSIEKILDLYHAGVRDFGENKVQELLHKANLLPSDIRWHLIGHLQRNKVKALLPVVHLIHSLDSERLFHEILNQAKRLEQKIQVLIQVQISPEDTKFGMPIPQVIPFLSRVFPLANAYISLQGFMGMASNSENKQLIQNEFKSLNALFYQVKSLPDFSHIAALSMGMSDIW